MLRPVINCPGHPVATQAFKIQALLALRHPLRFCVASQTLGPVDVST